MVLWVLGQPVESADGVLARGKLPARAFGKGPGKRRSLAGHWRVQWVRRWNVARPLDGSELKGIKEALALGHPVACGLRWPKTLQGHVLREVPPPRDVFDGHSVVLVGYADDPKQNGGGMFVFRNSSGPRWGEKGYGRVSYAYVRAYANERALAQVRPGASQAPLERFEAESMAVISRHRCEVNAQNMAEWGGPMWGGGQQLFCRAHPGGFVTLAFSNRRRGGYRLRVLATTAPDYGVVRVASTASTWAPKSRGGRGGRESRSASPRPIRRPNP